MKTFVSFAHSNLDFNFSRFSRTFIGKGFFTKSGGGARPGGGGGGCKV